MRRLRPVLLGLAAGLLVAAVPAAGADDPAVIRLTIVVGDVAPVGPGPVRNLICDDAGLVEPTDVGGSPGLRGLRAGSTLCSLTDALSIRRTYRVVVVDRRGQQGRDGSTPQDAGGR